MDLGAFMLAMTAEASSYEEIFAELQDRLTEHAVNPSEKAKNAVFAMCMVALAKQANDAAGGPEAFLADVDKTKRARDFFKTGEEPSS